mmetsp:Transcript_91161/g.229168  ORF Transcript_91161/g.229168 Transcript_91161/m.229168 type:complete len:217 (-) Transcript_91161:18-668(-)
MLTIIARAHPHTIGIARGRSVQTGVSLLDLPPSAACVAFDDLDQLLGAIYVVARPLVDRVGGRGGSYASAVAEVQVLHRRKESGLDFGHSGTIIGINIAPLYPTPTGRITACAVRGEILVMGFTPPTAIGGWESVRLARARRGVDQVVAIEIRAHIPAGEGVVYAWARALPLHNGNCRDHTSNERMAPSSGHGELYAQQDLVRKRSGECVMKMMPL